MMTSLYFDRDGIPITSSRWGELLHDGEYKRVARTTIMDAATPDTVWEVSTVWLGIDHSWGDGLPLIFETMVFAAGSSMDETCERYGTLAAAQEGHTAMVVTVAATLTDAIVMDAKETDRA